MELELYFDIPASLVDFKKENPESISKYISLFEPKLIKIIDTFDIALIGVKDDRNSQNRGSSEAPDIIRKYFYKLYNQVDSLKIIDLGNLISGKSIDDTYCALSDVIEFLYENKVIPVIFGSAQDISFPITKALSKILTSNLVITYIDSKLDCGNKDELHNNSILSFIEDKITPCKINVLGSQNYLIPSTDFDFIEKTKLTLFRLGKIREDIKKTEPFLRDSHFTCIDNSAIRQCDAPGNKFSSPNGITGEEACQLSKYSGLSEKTIAFQLCEYNPVFDFNEQTAHLNAQILWHFIDGFYNRKNDYPYESIDNLQKYIINSDELETNFVFYKSPKTDRWWIEISDSNVINMVPCNQEDYLYTCQNGLPDIYFREKSRIKYLQTK